MLASAQAAREIPISTTGRREAGRLATWLAESDISVSLAEDGFDRAVFEGVLYNRGDLAAATSALPESADAALVLRAYRLWGEGAVRRIKGRFALCVWDGSSEVLLCARDPLGYHPLFFADTGRGLLLSSSIETLVHHPGVSPEPSRIMLAEHLAHQWVDNRQTFFTAVRRVPPGHVLLAGRDERRLFRYWAPVPSGERVKWIQEDELAQFEGLLTQAVARCLRHGPAGIFLSGGLDSAAIAAVAADVSRGHGLPVPWALSLAFPDPECNEEDTQRRLAAALGLPQVLIPVEEAVGAGGFLPSLLAMAREWPFPTWFVWRPAYARLAREAAGRGCRVILTGDAGDDWLTVDAIVAADQLRGLQVADFIRLVANMRRSYTAGLPRLLAYLLWTNGARPWLRWAAVRSLRATAPGLLQARRRRRIVASIPSWIAPDPALRREIEERGVAGIEDPDPGSDGFYVSTCRQMLDHPVAAMEVEESFEAGRRAGIPEADPFRDSDLVDFLYRMPPEMLNRGGRSKGPVRQMLARRFPGLGYERQKKVQADAYLTKIIFREGRRAWESLGGAPALIDLGIVDAKALAEEAEALLSGRKGREVYRILDVLTLEAWLQSRM